VPEVSLEVSTYEIQGWQSVQIQRGLDDVADAFDVVLSSPLSSRPPPIPIREGSAVKLRYGDDLLLSGYIDRVSESSSASAFRLQIAGRSAAKDLIDCSAVHKGAWRGMTLDKIAAAIAEPFGLHVSTDVLGLPTETFRLQDGETCWEAIDRLVREHGLRVVSDPSGHLNLTRTGSTRYPDVVIERGVNIVEGGIERTEDARFSQYIFKASLAADDESYGEGNATKFAVEDEGVDRYRPLIVQLEGGGKKNAARLKEAAAWERNVRAGKSQTLSYRVVMPGAVGRSWEMPNGHGLWTPNTIVTVRDKNHDVDGEFLITQVTLRRSVTGTEALLELTHPEAYEPQKPPKKKGKKGYRW
jgi:prophage tail gpP-like protein